MLISREEYVQLGGKLDEQKFDMIQAKAHQLIRRATHGRAEDEEPARAAVKACAFDLIEMMAAEDGSGRAISSASNDGVSVTYAARADPAQDFYARASMILRLWLGGEKDRNGTFLLYAGVEE